MCVYYLLFGLQGSERLRMVSILSDKKKMYSGDDFSGLVEVFKNAAAVSMFIDYLSVGETHGRENELIPEC